MAKVEVTRKRIMNDLKAGYAFILLPFIILAFVRTYWGEGLISIITAPDWSLASCIIFGQITASMSKAVVSTRRAVNSSAFNYQTSKRFVCVVISCLLYFSMLIKPNQWLGAIQLAWFLFSSYRYFSDGLAVGLLGDDDSSN